MSAKKSLTGYFQGVTRFGKLTLIGDAPPRGSGKQLNRMALFRCDCGAKKEMDAKGVLRGKSKSCGCATGKGKNLEDACGGLKHQFLTVTGQGSGPTRGKGAPARPAICLCVCGKEFTAMPSQIKNGNVRSCGCMIGKPEANRGRTHGMSKTPEYGIWCGMRRRCCNPNNRAFKDYGGRGITICERWDKFENFFADMGERPNPKLTLERKDNDGPYSPDNCKWDTRAAQSKNRRTTKTFIINGDTHYIVTFCAETGLESSWVYAQIREKELTLSDIARNVSQALAKYLPT